MTRRQLAYLALTQFMTIVVLAISGYGYTNYVDHRRVEGQRAEAAKTRLIVCKISLGQADAFREATSEIGQQAREGWLALAREYHCE